MIQLENIFKSRRISTHREYATLFDPLYRKR